MIRMKLFCTAMLLLSVAFGATAQQPATDMQGYVDVSGLKIPATVQPEVEVYLEKTLLRVLAGAAFEVAPQIGEIVQGLSLVQVKIFEDAGDGVNLEANSMALLNDLLMKGWTTILRVPEDNVNFLMKSDGDNIAGLLGLIAEDDEVVFINVVGVLEPEMTGRLLGQVGIRVIKGDTDMDELLEILIDGSLGTAPSAAEETSSSPNAEEGEIIYSDTMEMNP